MKLCLFTIYIILVLLNRCFCSSKSTFWRFFPNYVVSYGPLLAVMIALPILYYLSSGSVPVIVAQYLSQYTNRERHIVNMIKIRFSLINLTFYACWLPNIINMILLYTVWENWNRRFIITIWYIMVRFYLKLHLVFIHIGIVFKKKKS